MDISTINYFIAISTRKFTFHKLPFGIAQICSQKSALFEMFILIEIESSLLMFF
tara:strand:+ start:2489 stop:2650 length:162 start_codon:yes stop_codon:yes gene_type:complete